MPFDAARYENEVIRPLRGSRARVLDSNLVRRYAIPDNLTAEQLRAHLSELRAFWAERAKRPDTGAEVCKALIAADRELAEALGPSLGDPVWWRRQPRPTEQPRPPDQRRPTSARPAGPVPPDSPGLGAPGRAAADPLTVGDRSTSATTPTPGWPGAARKRIRRLAERIARDEITTTGTGPAAATLGATPADAPTLGAPLTDAAAAGPVSGAAAAEPSAAPPLHAAVVGLRAGDVLVRLSWPTPSSGVVRVRRGAGPPPWTAETSIGADQVDRFGAEVPGQPRAEGSQTVLEAAVPVGYQVYVPIAVHGATAVVGRAVGLGLGEPVGRLRPERAGDRVRLVWEWPPDVGLAEVRWTTAAGTGVERVSRARYDDENGYLVPAGPGGLLASVSTVTVRDATEAVSQPATVEVGAPPARLAYAFRRPPLPIFPPRKRVLDLTADRDCAGVTLRVVAASGLAMPIDPDSAAIAVESAELAFTAGQRVSIPFEVPAPVHRNRPYWLRCFLLRGPVTLVDPPITRLEGGLMFTLVCPYCYDEIDGARLWFRCTGRKAPGRSACVPQADRARSGAIGIDELVLPSFAAPAAAVRSGELGRARSVRRGVRDPGLPVLPHPLPANFGDAAAR